MAVLFVGWFAWCSTSITNQPLIRTVLILRDRATSTRVSLPRAQSNASNLSVQDDNRLHNSVEEETALETASNTSESTEPSYPNAAAVDTTELSQEILRSDSMTTEEVLIETMDSLDDTNRSPLQSTVKENNSDSAVNEPTSNSSEESLTSDSGSDITIKLKFINDDQKIVTGGLKETLGDFKRKHFQMELEARKAVRLVFNGRVLQPDTQTLEQCGLFNDCVVHCWVHQPRPATVPSSTLDNSSIYFNSQSFTDLPNGSGISSIHNDWDLSRLLVSLLTIILGLAWYSRYHYAQLFTATTTLALYFLTAIFAVSLFSNFLPDQDNIRNVE
ncbi:hypothetical protein PUN28_001705 [Cardiocondyla obscurior]